MWQTYFYQTTSAPDIVDGDLRNLYPHYLGSRKATRIWNVPQSKNSKMRSSFQLPGFPQCFQHNGLGICGQQVMMLFCEQKVGMANTFTTGVILLEVQRQPWQMTECHCLKINHPLHPTWVASLCKGFQKWAIFMLSIH